MYSLITYADLVEGMTFPSSGIYSVIEDMVKLGGEMGVRLRTESPVAEIVVEGGAARKASNRASSSPGHHVQRRPGSARTAS